MRVKTIGPLSQKDRGVIEDLHCHDGLFYTGCLLANKSKAFLIGAISQDSILRTCDKNVHMWPTFMPLIMSACCDRINNIWSRSLLWEKREAPVWKRWWDFVAYQFNTEEDNWGGTQNANDGQSVSFYSSLGPGLRQKQVQEYRQYRRCERIVDACESRSETL